jgi:hypothetical protein
MKKLLAALALVAFGGCAIQGPPPPQYGDAFANLYNRSSTSVPDDAPVTMQQPTAIIFSDNVEKWYAFLKVTKEFWRAKIPASLQNHVAEADGDPDYLSGRVLEVLKRRFPDSEYVKDFGQAAGSGKRSAVLVDVLPQPMKPWEDHTTRFDITLYFFDAKMNPVSRISGHGETHIQLGRADAGIQQTIDAALAQLDGKMEKLVH